MKICNCCARPIYNPFDNDSSLNFTFGYESEFDGDTFQGDFCCECTDKIAKVISAMCELPVIHDIDYEGDNITSSLTNDTEHTHTVIAFDIAHRS